MGDGLFVVVEGPDASGKETQTERLVSWLREQGYSDIPEETEAEICSRLPAEYPGEDYDDGIEDGVWRLSFPTYGQTPGGRVVDYYLNGKFGGHADLSTDEKADIYAADRFQFKDVMKDFYDAGGVIVCDRYRESNLIHQLVGYEGEEWEAKLAQLQMKEDDLLDQDIVLYLHISPEASLRRMEEKDKDIHEQDEAYMRASNENGLAVAKHEGWTIVDGERPRDAITADLKDHVQDLLEDNS